MGIGPDQSQIAILASNDNYEFSCLLLQALGLLPSIDDIGDPGSPDASLPRPFIFS